MSSGFWKFYYKAGRKKDQKTVILHKWIAELVRGDFPLHLCIRKPLRTVLCEAAYILLLQKINCERNGERQSSEKNDKYYLPICAQAAEYSGFIGVTLVEVARNVPKRVAAIYRKQRRHHWGFSQFWKEAYPHCTFFPSVLRRRIAVPCCAE